MTRARSVFNREANATRDADLRRQRQLERQELGRLPRGVAGEHDEDACAPVAVAHALEHRWPNESPRQKPDAEPTSFAAYVVRARVLEDERLEREAVLDQRYWSEQP